MKGFTWIELMIVIAIIGNCILDYFHTVTLVSFGMEETNPIVLWIVGKGNWQNLLYIKIILLGILGILLTINHFKKGVIK